MKKVLFFCALICPIIATAQTAKMPRYVNELLYGFVEHETLELSKYKKALAGVDLSQYQFVEKRRRISFEDGVTIELKSKNESGGNGSGANNLAVGANGDVKFKLDKYGRLITLLDNQDTNLK